MCRALDSSVSPSVLVFLGWGGEVGVDMVNFSFCCISYYFYSSSLIFILYLVLMQKQRKEKPASRKVSKFKAGAGDSVGGHGLEKGKRKVGRHEEKPCVRRTAVSPSILRVEKARGLGERKVGSGHEEKPCVRRTAVSRSILNGISRY